MKVKIKGLVFVGFAAAILSANAMADQRVRPAGSSNTVTSQAFTEAKYEWLSDKVGTTPAGNSELWDSEDAYPSMKVLSGVMDTIESNQVTGSTYIDTDTSGANTQVLIDPDQIANTVAKIDAGGTPLTTAGAVEDYVNVRGVKVNGSALTPDASKDVNVTVASGTGDGTIAVNGIDVAVTNAEVTTNKLLQGTNTGSVITDQATDTQYPSAKAVYNALTDTSNVGNGTISATQNGVAAGSFTVNQSGAGSITIAAPDWDAASDSAAYIDNKPTIQTAGTSIGGATNATSEQKNLPTSYAVKEYVQSITNGNTLPAQDTTVCTATQPCALVNENGNLNWRTMATATHNGGTCGNAGGTCPTTANP